MIVEQATEAALRSIRRELAGLSNAEIIEALTIIVTTLEDEHAAYVKHVMKGQMAAAGRRPKDTK